MEQHLKERLVGATVLIILAAIFIPMFLSEQPVMKQEEEQAIETVEETQLNYHSSVVPIESGENASSKSSDETSDGALPNMLEKKTADVASSGNRKTDDKKAVSGSDKSEPTEPVADKNEIGEHPPVKTDVGTTQAWVVQLGSFGSEANAQTLNKRLLDKDFPSFIEPLVQGEKVVYRVRVGPMLQKEKIEKIQSQIKNTLKLNGILIKYP